MDIERVEELLRIVFDEVKVDRGKTILAFYCKLNGVTEEYYNKVKKLLSELSDVSRIKISDYKNEGWYDVMVDIYVAKDDLDKFMEKFEEKVMSLM